MLTKSFVKIALAIALAVGISSFASHTVSADVVLGQVDDFSGGTADDWVEGGASPNPPTHNSGTGPDGAAGHLQNAADGAGSGGRLLMWNDDNRWQGNYITAGVPGINFAADNRSGNGTQMNLRIGMFGGGGWFVSNAVALADGSGWTDISYDLSSLTHVAAGGGTGVLNDTLTSVTRFEILSAAGTPSFGSGGNLLQGDNLVGDLRIDNITAVPEPGMIGLLAIAGLAGLSRRRRS